MTDSENLDYGDDPLQTAMQRGAALFLRKALDINDGDVDEFAADLAALKRDANAATYSIHLDSSVGPAAFLVYAYVLDTTGGDGRTGKEMFDAGLETLREAHRNNSPGPRALAHAESGEWGYILATTPGTYRALTGEGGPQPEPAAPVRAYTVEEALELRGDTSEQLLESLRVANERATAWLEAIRISNDAEYAEFGVDDLLEFTDRETELALYLLDETSIRDLLGALNLIVATAQERAATLIAGDDASEEEDAGEQW